MSSHIAVYLIIVYFLWVFLHLEMQKRLQILHTWSVAMFLSNCCAHFKETFEMLQKDELCELAIFLSFGLEWINHELCITVKKKKKMHMQSLHTSISEKWREFFPLRWRYRHWNFSVTRFTKSCNCQNLFSKCVSFFPFSHQLSFGKPQNHLKWA